MGSQRPTIAERLRRDGPPTPPRQSASLILVRDGDGDGDGNGAIELLLVQRSPEQRFMGGFWVFPGGAVDEGETHAATAVRELAEEAGITGVDPAALVLYSRWITPEAIQTRFDTQFFVARAPDGAQPRVDGRYCVDVRCTSPAAAVAAYGDDELALVFPTLRLLEGLASFATIGDLLEHARGLTVAPILPRVVTGGGAPRVLLPGEPGYERPDDV
jgi:8-oxo-dGTP pyrophosphatase MutT (NUDIX family)